VPGPPSQRTSAAAPASGARAQARLTRGRDLAPAPPAPAPASRTTAVAAGATQSQPSALLPVGNARATTPDATNQSPAALRRATSDAMKSRESSPIVSSAPSPSVTATTAPRGLRVGPPPPRSAAPPPRLPAPPPAAPESDPPAAPTSAPRMALGRRRRVAPPALPASTRRRSPSVPAAPEQPASPRRFRRTTLPAIAPVRTRPRETSPREAGARHPALEPRPQTAPSSRDVAPARLDVRAAHIARASLTAARAMPDRLTPPPLPSIGSRRATTSPLSPSGRAPAPSDPLAGAPAVADYEEHDPFEDQADEPSDDGGSLSTVVGADAGTSFRLRGGRLYVAGARSDVARADRRLASGHLARRRGRRG
jgi:hypothetical protein